MNFETFSKANFNKSNLQISVLNEKLQEKNETAEKLKMLEEFDKTHKNFDKKCREVMSLLTDRRDVKISDRSRGVRSA